MARATCAGGINRMTTIATSRICAARRKLIFFLEATGRHCREAFPLEKTVDHLNFSPALAIGSPLMRPSHFPRALYPFSWAASSLTSGNSRRHRNRSQSEMLVRRIRAPARTAPADSSGPAYSSSENGADSSHIRRHRGSSCRCNSYAYDVFFPGLRRSCKQGKGTYDCRYPNSKGTCFHTHLTRVPRASIRKVLQFADLIPAWVSLNVG